MAKSSIRPGAGSQADAPASENLPATQPGSAPVPYSGDRNNYDSPNRDQIIPKLGLVNATGPLAKKFRADYGKYVFEERLVLGGEVPVIPLRLDKYFVECRRGGTDLKFEDEKKIFRSAREAQLAGYALDWDSQHVNKAEEAATITFLVAGPADDVADAFFITAAGLTFAPAVHTVRRGAYRDVYRQLYTAQSRAELRGGKLWHGLWELYAKTDCSSPNRDNEWAESRIRPKSKLTAEDIAGLEKLALGYSGNTSTQQSE